MTDGPRVGAGLVEGDGPGEWGGDGADTGDAAADEMRRSMDGGDGVAIITVGEGSKN